MSSARGTRYDMLLLERLLGHMINVSLENKVKDPQQWVDKVDQCSSIVNKMLKNAEENESAVTITNLWRLLRLEKLYIEHVVYAQSKLGAENKTVKRPTFSLPRMQGIIYPERSTKIISSKEKTFTEVRDNFLPLAVRDGIMILHLKCPLVECPGCGKPWKYPERLECGHFLCASCIRGKSMKKTCRTDHCEHVIPDGYCFDIQTGDKEEDQKVSQYRHFRGRINNFFMHFVSEIIFEPDYTPSKNMIKWLLQCITSSETQFCLFDPDSVISKSSSVNMFLLKLLLQSLHIDDVSSVLNNKLSSSNSLELHHQILEHFREIESYTVDDVCKEMISLAETLQSTAEADPIQQLKMVANIQRILSTSVSLLIENPNEFVNMDEPLSKLVTSRGFGVQLGYFVVRQLFSILGYSRICELYASKQSYLVPQDLQRYFYKKITVPDYLAVTCFNDESNQELRVEAVKQVKNFFLYPTPSLHVTADPSELLQLWGHDSTLILASTYTAMVESADYTMDSKAALYLSGVLNRQVNTLSQQQQRLFGLLLNKTKLPIDMNLKTVSGRNVTMLVINVVNSLCIDSDGGFLYPLQEIIQQPSECKKYYLPAMPGDKRGYIRRKTPTLLLSASSTEERWLSPLSCAVLRCIVHIALYSAALTNPEQLEQLIQDQPAESAPEYLVAQLRIYLQQISECSGDSLENCLFLLHSVIFRMKTESDEASNVKLVTPQDRAVWEKKFSTIYIQSIFLENRQREPPTITARHPCAEIIASLKVALAPDEKTEEQPTCSAKLWTYHPTLTLTSTINKLSFEQKRYPALQALLPEQDLLITLRYFPDIVKLNQLLCSSFTSKLSRTDTEKWTIRDFRLHVRSPEVNESNPQLKHQLDRLEDMLDSFFVAWTHMIEHPRCPPGEYESLNRSSRLEDILNYKYSKKETCPVVLMKFLTETHNRVVKKCVVSERSTIDISEMSESSLVIIENKDILLSIIQQHGEYDLRAGAADPVTYDWEAAEREVYLRYIIDKPLINISKEWIPKFIYQEDFTLYNQITALSHSQERLSPKLVKEITEELTTAQITDLKNYLSDLQVIINFMSTSVVDTDGSLLQHIRKVFPVSVKHGYLTEDIQLKHVKHVWMLLRYCQVSLLLNRNQTPFDGIHSDYTDNVLPHLKAELAKKTTYKGTMTMALIHELFEFIIMALNKEAILQNSLDPNTSLVTALEQYIGQTNSETERAAIIGSMWRLHGLYTTSQAKEVWCCLWKHATNPRYQQNTDSSNSGVK